MRDLGGALLILAVITFAAFVIWKVNDDCSRQVCPPGTKATMTNRDGCLCVAPKVGS